MHIINAAQELLSHVVTTAAGVILRESFKVYGCYDRRANERASLVSMFRVQTNHRPAKVTLNGARAEGEERYRQKITAEWNCLDNEG